jgi:hypothetical protein
MKITRKSALSGLEHTMDLPITQEQFDRWQLNSLPGLIQHVFPHLTADQREFLMTGVTQEEWDATFKDDEEE